jgi:hypothetical protein
MQFSEDEFFSIEENIANLLVKYLAATKERTLDFDDNLKMLVDRAKEDI